MVRFPQSGACLCGDVGYRLDEDPLTIYACHCTDCQRQTGSSFSLAVLARREALKVERGRPERASVVLADGRPKGGSFCPRCHTSLWGNSRVAGLVIFEGGTLDDTSWLRPVAHIWTRSAQPWVVLPPDAMRFAQQPQQDDYVAMVRAWKQGADT